jgi:hypothetical protein
MNDTPPDVEQTMTALFMRRPASERAMMAFEMFDMARALMTANIRASRPDISDADLRVAIFERTYGADFDEADRRRIIARIRSAD